MNVASEPRARARRLTFLSCCAASVVWIVGCKEEVPAPPPPPPQEVGVEEVVARDLPWTLEHIAQTSASREVEIRARVQGWVSERKFTEGALIEAGTVLFTIDARPFEAALAAARARLVEAQAKVAEATRVKERKRSLVEGDAAPRRELEDAETSVQLATALQAVAQAELEQAQLDLEYTQVKMPLTGRIGKALREPGSLVDAGENSLLATVMQLDPIYVSFRLSEREMLEWTRGLETQRLEMKDGEAGLRVEVERVDGSPYPHFGVINYRAVEIDPMTGTAEVRASLPNPDQALLPGQFLRAKVLGITRRAVLSVAQRAVMMGGDATHVYVVDAQNKVELRPIELGPWSGNDWIVEKGLVAGERVIVDGLQKTGAGRDVKPIAATQSAPRPDARGAATTPGAAQGKVVEPASAGERSSKAAQPSDGTPR